MQRQTEIIFKAVHCVHFILADTHLPLCYSLSSLVSSSSVYRLPLSHLGQSLFVETVEHVLNAYVSLSPSNWMYRWRSTSAPHPHCIHCCVHKILKNSVLYNFSWMNMYFKSWINTMIPFSSGHVSVENNSIELESGVLTALYAFMYCIQKYFKGA